MKNLLDLEADDCRYPISQDARGHLFCANPRRDEACSYCAECAEIAFTGYRGLEKPHGGNAHAAPKRRRWALTLGSHKDDRL